MRMKIRDLREDQDLTQQKMAEYLDCDQSLYSKYERGERDVPVHILVKLALFYNTSVDYLVGLTKEKKPYERVK
ncbi:MAG: helix-turn-helix transcriptional regulator [Bacillota bacterium]